MRWTLVVVGAFLAALAAVPGVAAAQTVQFVPQFEPASLPEGSSFALTGDRVTGFSAILKPTACAAPADFQDSSDSTFTLQLPATADVELNAGAFSFQGAAASSYPGSQYGGTFAVSGTVNPAHTVVTGTVTLADAHDPSVTGCSGSYKFIAIPKLGGPYRPPGRAAYQGRGISFNYAAGVISNLQLTANVMCGTSVDATGIDGRAAHLTLRTGPGGRFSYQSYELDSYDEVMSVTISGRIHGRHASGRIVVDEPPGFTGLTGQPCGSNFRWTAAKPTPPGPPAPTAFFQWGAVRVPFGGAYRYYFAVFGLSCRAGANEVIVHVADRRLALTCGRRAEYASGPLVPGRTYVLKAQAVRVRRGRVVRRGLVVPTTQPMPGPNDRWIPIAGLPGVPPS